MATSRCCSSKPRNFSVDGRATMFAAAMGSCTAAASMSPRTFSSNAIRFVLCPIRNIS